MQEPKAARLGDVDAGHADDDPNARSASLVVALRGGDESAFGQLYDQWFDGVFDMALRIVRDREVAAEVAQDAFLAAWRNIDGLAEPRAFGGWLLRITRNKSFNRLEKERRSRPVDDEGMTVIEATSGSGTGGPAGFSVEDRAGSVSEPEQAAQDAELSELLWEAAEALGERDANVLDLHLRRGFTPTQIAEALDVTPNNANQLVHRVKSRLGDSVRARIVWRGGDPRCPGLKGALAAEGIAVFDKNAVRVIAKHVEACEACAERQATRLAPATMFAATPLIAAPIAFRSQIADALAADGVPMDGSEAFGEGAGDAAVAGADLEFGAGGDDPDDSGDDSGDVADGFDVGTAHGAGLGDSSDDAAAFADPAAGFDAADAGWGEQAGADAGSEGDGSESAGPGDDTPELF